jgi:hypothetical protein
MNVKPTFIGIGVQKCATKWIYRVLKDHPQTWLGHPKGLDFFSYFYGFGFQWYETHFAGGEGKSAIGEMSASYFHDFASRLRTSQYNPSFRIILTWQDQVDRAHSNHLHDTRVWHHKGDLSF